MNVSSIQLNAETTASGLAGELLDLVQTASIRILNGDSPVGTEPSIRLDALGSLATVSETGNLRCVAQSCISDVSMSADPAMSAGAEILVQTQQVGDLANMVEHSDFSRIQADITGMFPKLDLALAGHMNQTELAQLISDLQSQVLELNSSSAGLFGDLGLDVAAAVSDIEHESSEDLLASLLVDSAFLSQPFDFSDLNNLANSTTLDGLFTAPETFPLTLDFSTSDAVQEATELFAAAGGSSSISSSADSAGADVPLDGSGRDIS